METAIKGVLLDVGGVLVDLDGMPSLAALIGSVDSSDSLHDRWMGSAAVVAHETGRISANEFAATVTTELGLRTNPEAYRRPICREHGTPISEKRRLSRIVRSNATRRPQDSVLGWNER